MLTNRGFIQQRLAVIEIPPTEDEILLYDWTGELCSARDEAQVSFLNTVAPYMSFIQLANFFLFE